MKHGNRAKTRKTQKTRKTRTPHTPTQAPTTGNVFGESFRGCRSHIPHMFVQFCVLGNRFGGPLARSAGPEARPGGTGRGGGGSWARNRVRGVGPGWPGATPERSQTWFFECLRDVRCVVECLRSVSRVRGRFHTMRAIHMILTRSSRDNGNRPIVRIHVLHLRQFTHLSDRRRTRCRISSTLRRRTSPRVPRSGARVAGHGARKSRVAALSACSAFWRACRRSRRA